MQLNMFFFLFCLLFFISYIKCKLKKLISCLIGDTKSRVWLSFRYPVGISALNELNMNEFLNINDISHSKNRERKQSKIKNNKLSYSNLKMFNKMF